MSNLISLSTAESPIVFRAGSAEILGKFERTPDRIILELAHINGGGEGTLPALGALASRYAAQEHLAFLEWRVHAVNCANPNLKLRQVLQKRGFEIKRSRVLVSAITSSSHVRLPSDLACVSSLQWTDRQEGI